MVQKSLAMTEDQPVPNGSGYVSLRTLGGVCERVTQCEIRGYGCGEGTARSVRARCFDPGRVKFQEMMPIEQDIDHFRRTVVSGR